MNLVKRYRESAMGRTSAEFFCAAIIFLASGSLAFAQAGSTGGTIGKQDKSISGSEETDNPRSAPHSKRPAPHSQETSSGPACNRIVGTWKWGGGFGLTEMTFNQNGTVRQSLTGSTGSWLCSGTMVKTAFTNGSTDRITMSKDGNHAAVTTTWGGGHSFNVTRLSGGIAQ
jgi:hypothetical protein